jgi:hypothetical protein
MAGQPTTIRTDQVRKYYNTKEYWLAHDDMKPKKGDIIIYTNMHSVIVDGVRKDLPAIKIGDGKTTLANISFLGEYESQVLLDHINDNERHITQQEREFWNNKLNIGEEPVQNRTLIFTRN